MGHLESTLWVKKTFLGLGLGPYEGIGPNWKSGRILGLVGLNISCGSSVMIYSFILDKSMLGVKGSFTPMRSCG